MLNLTPEKLIPSVPIILLNSLLTKVSEKAPLRTVIIVPFVLQIFVAVGLVGYLSFRNGQKAVNNLATQLQSEISDRIQQRLDHYLEVPPVLAQINADAIRLNQLNVQEKANLTRHFWTQKHLFDSVNVSAIYFGSVQGEFTGLGFQDDNTWQISRVDQSTGGKFYSFAPDNQGNPTTLLQIGNPYDPRIRPWYQDAVQAGKPVWSKIYIDFKEPRLKVTLAQPIYTQDNKLRGVVGVDFVLSHISEFLKGLNIGKSGQTFIMERSGMIVASSTEEEPFLRDQEGNIKQRLQALNSRVPLIRATAEYLNQHFSNFAQLNSNQQFIFTIEGKPQFLQVTPLKDSRGIDWLIVVVVPEADFMEQIDANTQTTILLCMAALVVAIIIGILTAGWVTKPILRLNTAAKEIAKGEWNKTVEIERSDELGQLAKSFNSMARQLQDSFTTLEQKVAERTAQLAVAKEKAEVANQAKSTFIANMSHELRTPLNAILGFSQLMMKSQSIPSEHLENVGLIIRSGEHLLTLINQVLDVSKIEAGRITLNEKNFDLYRLLDDMEDMFQIKATDKGLQLVFECAPDVPRYVRTDEVKLRQILINLLNNALKFTCEGGVLLRVAMENREGEIENRQESYNFQSPNPNSRLVFEVEDTGAGIAPEELDSLFEAFVQTKTGKEAQEGTGLGLSIAYKFVQLMGGDITVRSQVGQGTTFTFDIQVSRVDANDIEYKQQTRRVIALEPNQPRYRILIVDDKSINRQLLIKLLNPMGFELKEASNGKEAISLWEMWEPHLIWMDMRMPIMDGYEATKHIKTTTKGQATAIIALTASVFEEERAVVLSAGCDDFLRKPFREEDILAAMSKHIGVRYVYDSHTPEPLKFSETSSKLTSADLQALPREWIVSLKQAITNIDLDGITTLIEEIQTENAILANNLKQCIDQFEYDKILNLIQDRGESNH